MNRAVLRLLSPLALLLLALLSIPLGGTTAPAIFLLSVASLLSLVLAATQRDVQVKKSVLSQKAALYLLFAFNFLLVAAIIVEVLALFSLINLIDPFLSQRSAWYVWTLAVLLIAGLNVVLLERRINAPTPPRRPSLLAVAGTLTFANVLLTANALLIGRTNFLFLTPLGLEPGQAIYLLLTGATLQAVAAMIIFRIPALFELIFLRSTQTQRILAITSASPLLFTIGFTLLTLLVSILLVIFADRVHTIDRVLPENVALRLLLVFPVALITFFVVAALLTYQQMRPKYKLQMDAHQRILITLGVLSALLTVVSLFLAFRLGRGDTITIRGFVLLPTYWPEALVAAILFATAPLGFYLQHRETKLSHLELWLSDFLRDLAETSKAGLPLHQSLRAAAEKDYGPLTPEIHRMSTQCSWGLSFSEAFRRFGERTQSRLVRRASNLVVETAVSGGNTGEVLTATAIDIHQQKSLDQDRHAAMSSYVAVIYIVFFVFIAILGVLAALFLPQLLGATQAAAQAGASTSLFSSSRINLRSVKDAYFHALLVQAIGNGIIIGMIRDASIGTAFKHIVLLVLVSYAAYRLFLV